MRAISEAEGKTVRRRRRRLGEQQLAYLLLAPAFLLVIAIIGYPILNTIITAFSKTNAVSQLMGFAGFANFGAIFNDPVFIQSLLRTLLWTLWVVGLTTLVSLLLSLILQDSKLIGRKAFRLILLLPWATSVTMTTIAWKWLIDGQLGLISGTLQVWGWIAQPFGFLSHADSAFIVAIIIAIIVSIPFTTAVLSSGLLSIPLDIYDAGQIDGAGSWARFRYLTLPHLMPFLTITLVINIINVFNSFPIIWTLTEGGPANGTQVAVTYLFKTAFKVNQFSQAAAMSLITFLAVLLFSVLSSIQTMRRRT
jgi:multiple sugar transport system permease protein